MLVYAPLTACQERYYTSILNRSILEMVEKDHEKRLAELGWGKENLVPQEHDLEEEETDGLRKSKRLKNKQIR